MGNDGAAEISWQPWGMQIGKARALPSTPRALLPHRVVVAFQGFPRASFLFLRAFPPSRGNVILLFKTGVYFGKVMQKLATMIRNLATSPRVSLTQSSVFYYISFFFCGGEQRNIILHSNCEIHFFVIIGEKLKGKRLDLNVHLDRRQYNDVETLTNTYLNINFINYLVIKNSVTKFLLKNCKNC